MYQLVPVHGDTGTIGLQPGLTDIGRETLGELGAEVLDTIHRSQHAQVRLEGSRVLLTRLGSNPTGVRCRGAAWKWLAQHETAELADAMELAFSKSKRLIAQSTFVLRRTPTVGSEGASKSEHSGQPERGVEAAPAPVNKRPPAEETQEPCILFGQEKRQDGGYHGRFAAPHDHLDHGREALADLAHEVVHQVDKRR